jgi:hypothetical protein
LDGAGPEWDIEFLEVSRGAFLLPVSSRFPEENGIRKMQVKGGSFQVLPDPSLGPFDNVPRTDNQDRCLEAGMHIKGSNLELTKPLKAHVHLRRRPGEDGQPETLIFTTRTPHNGPTALLLAILSEADDVTRLLVESGADVNASSYKLRALDLAAVQGRADLVRYLLGKGATTNNDDAMVGLALEILGRWRQTPIPGAASKFAGAASKFEDNILEDDSDISESASNSEYLSCNSNA